jgi:hypothetical protein
VSSSALSHAKDPATRKRVARLNPEKAWIVHSVPGLRIVDDALWEQVKQLQVESRVVVGIDSARAMATRCCCPPESRFG